MVFLLEVYQSISLILLDSYEFFIPISPSYYCLDGVIGFQLVLGTKNVGFNPLCFYRLSGQLNEISNQLKSIDGKLNYQNLLLTYNTVQLHSIKKSLKNN